MQSREQMRTLDFIDREQILARRFLSYGFELV